MINLRNSPFLWLALLLLLSFGITHHYLPALPEKSINILICILMISAFYALRSNKPIHQYFSTLAIGVIIITIGVIRMNAYRSKIYDGNLLTHSIYIEGNIRVKQVLKNKGTSVSLRCERIAFCEAGGNKASLTGDKFCLVTIKTTEQLQFLPGDYLSIEGWLSAIPPPLNPKAFNARSYYNTLGIRHQIFCKQENVLINNSDEFTFSRLMAGWQFALSDISKKNISTQVAQLTNALVWGDRSDMDDEVRDAFADSGAMHVLSVSGMHVAIIYSMLFFLLGTPSAGTLSQRIVRFIFYSLAIAIYVALTGACPAVVRAGLMIMLFLLGKSLGWNTQIWNLLGFAAFLMLWINPFVWQNIGFQLSFLAMAGILLYAKPIIRSLTFRYKIVHLTWEICALSIAAQVFILPVLLSQFHQFPLTFMLSSIVAIPAAYIIMAGALICTILSFVHLHFLWTSLDWAGKAFIKSMQWMAELNPVMHFSLPSMCSTLLIMMAVLFSFGIVFRWKFGKRLAWYFGITAFVLLGYHRYQQWNKSDLIIYHSIKGVIVDIIADGYCYTIHDCSLTLQQIEFAARNYRCYRDIIYSTHICADSVFEFGKYTYIDRILSIDSLNVLFWDDDFIAASSDFNFLVIRKCNDVEKLKTFLADDFNKTIILPAHLNRNTREELMAYAREIQINIYDINENGYYKLSL